MIGTLNEGEKSATVIGGGLAGLLAAERLDRAGFEVTLIEATSRLGGMIRTESTPEGIAEAAAHSLLASQPVDELCASLGLKLRPLRSGSKARYVWRDGQMRNGLPLNLIEILMAFLRSYIVLADHREDPEKLTLDRWSLRHLGAPATRYLVTPFVRGIYGARPSEIVVSAAFPALVVTPGHSLISQMIHRWRKRLKTGEGGTRYRKPRMCAPEGGPEGGMESLVRKLERRLEARLGERLIRGRPVASLPSCSNLVLAVPAHRAAELLAPHDPSTAEKLRAVRYAPLVSATLFVKRSAFKRSKPPVGVGVLLPESTEPGEPGARRCLGVLFNSSSFEGRVADHREVVSMTMMLGGTGDPELARWPEDSLRPLIEEELLALFGVKPEGLVRTVIHRWPQAIPLYDQALVEAWASARAGWSATPGKILFGNYTGQVSIRGMIESAARLAAAAGRDPSAERVAEAGVSDVGR